MPALRGALQRIISDLVGFSLTSRKLMMMHRPAGASGVYRKLISENTAHSVMRSVSIGAADHGCDGLATSWTVQHHQVHFSFRYSKASTRRTSGLLLSFVEVSYRKTSAHRLNMLKLARAESTRPEIHPPSNIYGPPLYHRVSRSVKLVVTMGLLMPTVRNPRNAHHQRVESCRRLTRFLCDPRVGIALLQMSMQNSSTLP